ncbi:aKG-HExxH-type peptide beta-hydroxylase [Nostoc sp. FACHB-145]|uniref:aKG-HExxH-type peptide beta-hydroxylase n=1 Tax=Nostoc sp. FACHB-145 TaxID=2692836 RepID=UPI00168A08B8|nr:HEXXH motif-containing putative peptide modification protein [Nostoc sp. FACHB-145]MBD2470940.1 hypothetical protein [Nostoc sp. FACHB-145]
MSTQIEDQSEAVLRDRMIASRLELVREFAEVFNTVCDLNIEDLASNPARYCRVRQIQYACTEYEKYRKNVLEHLNTLLEDALSSTVWLGCPSIMAFHESDCITVVDTRNESSAFIPLNKQSSEKALEASGMLSNAFFLIQLWPGWACLSKHVGQIVTLKNLPPGTNTMRSYTLSMLPCTVYTDLVNNPIQLAETVVHEAAHNQLNEYIGNPSSLPQEHTWWSPWKQKYRPAFGILHAVYAFSSVVKFLIYLYQSEICDEHCHHQLQRRILREWHRLNEAQQSFEEIAKLVDDNILQMYLLSHFTHTKQLINKLSEEKIDGNL